MRFKLATVCGICYSTLILFQVAIWLYAVTGLIAGFVSSPETVDKIVLRNGIAGENSSLGYRFQRIGAPLPRPLVVKQHAFLQSAAPRLIKNKYVNDTKASHLRIKTIQLTAATKINLDETKIYHSAMLGHTILPRNPWVVLNGSYLVNPVNICRRHLDLDLVVVVHTAPYNFARRRMIREAFVAPSLPKPYTAQTVFILGTHNSTTVDDEKEQLLAREINDHNDFVRMDFQEGFRNLTYKALLWLRWLDEYCPNAMMILKIDDDVVMDVKKILPLSRGLFSKYNRSIFCSINRQGTQPIPRVGRTQVDPREFVGLKIYPYTYCSGFIVFLSRDLINLMSEIVRKIPMYNVDDVFMFGMVPKILGNVTYHNIGYNVTIWNEVVYNCTLSDGVECKYYGTMASKVEKANLMYDAFAAIHNHDFKIPSLLVK